MAPQQTGRAAEEARLIADQIAATRVLRSTNMRGAPWLRPSPAKIQANRGCIRATTRAPARQGPAKTFARPAKAPAKSGRNPAPIAAAPARSWKASAAVSGDCAELSCGLAGS